MKNFSKLRVKFLRPVYIPLFNFFNSYRKEIIHKFIARKYARKILSHVRTFPDKKIVINYDHRYFPPTYGDYMIILMIVRFLSQSGFNVSFSIIDLGRLGNVWSTLEMDSQNSFIVDQVSLAKRIVPENVNIKIIDSEEELSDLNQQVIVDGFLQMTPKENLTFLEWAPYLLYILTKKYRMRVPEHFLLASPTKKGEKPFITWNIRKSQWSSVRDTSENHLKNDFEEIRKLFPFYDLVILSSETGIKFAFKSLFEVDHPSIINLDGIQVIPQPDKGYLGAIDWILSSNYYLQRSGGGMTVPAIFSKVPFVHFLHEKSSIFVHFRTKYFIWNDSSQIVKRYYIKNKHLFSNFVMKSDKYS